MTKVNRSLLCRIGMSCVYVCMCSVRVYYALVRMLYYSHQKWSLKNLKNQNMHSIFIKWLFRLSLFHTNGSYTIWFDLKKKRKFRTFHNIFFVYETSWTHTDHNRRALNHMHTWRNLRSQERKKCIIDDALSVMLAVFVYSFFFLPSPPYVCSLALFIGFR